MISIYQTYILILIITNFQITSKKTLLYKVIYYAATIIIIIAAILVFMFKRK